MSDLGSQVTGRAASDFAKSASNWQTWAVSANIFTDQDITTEVRQQYDSLNELVIPRNFISALRNNHDVDYEPFASLLAQQLEALANPIYTPDDDDSNRIIAKWMSIADAYNQISTLDDHATNTNEAAVRKGVDLLVVASTSQTSAKILYEQGLRLVKSAEVEKAPSSLAKADTIVVSRMPTELVRALPRKAALSGCIGQLSWRETPPLNLESRAMDLLMSAIEYKTNNEAQAQRQLAYDLSVAQSVRRALKLPDRILFGFTSHFNKSIETLFMHPYACWWDGDIICLTSQCPAIQVSEPIGCLQFYNFLRKLNIRDGEDLTATVDASFISQLTGLLQNPDHSHWKNNSWRAPDRPQKRKSTSQHSTRKAPGGPTQAQGDPNDDDDDDMTATSISDDLPKTMEYDANHAAHDDGNLKKGSELEGNTGSFDWIGKHVPIHQGWTSQWVAAPASGESLLTNDDDFCI